MREIARYCIQIISFLIAIPVLLVVALPVLIGWLYIWASDDFNPIIFVGSIMGSVIIWILILDQLFRILGI